MPNPTARTRGRNCRAIRTPPDWDRIYFIPSFSLLIPSKSPAKGISHPGPLSLVGGGLTRGGRAFRKADWMGFQTRSSRFVVREILLVGIAAAASFVFINHDNL